MMNQDIDVPKEINVKNLIFDWYKLSWPDLFIRHHNVANDMFH